MEFDKTVTTFAEMLDICKLKTDGVKENDTVEYDGWKYKIGRILILNGKKGKSRMFVLHKE